MGSLFLMICAISMVVSFQFESGMPSSIVISSCAIIRCRLLLSMLYGNKNLWPRLKAIWMSVGMCILVCMTRAAALKYILVGRYFCSMACSSSSCSSLILSASISPLFSFFILFWVTLISRLVLAKAFELRFGSPILIQARFAVDLARRRCKVSISS